MFAITLTSCEDFLDVKPKGKLIPNTVSDYDKLMISDDAVKWNFLDNNTGSLIPNLTDDVKMTPAVEESFANSYNLDRFRAYKYEQAYVDKNTSSYMWDKGYANILAFNTIINKTNEVAVSDADKLLAKKIISQAKVGRAWIYFNFANIYGPVFDPNGKNDGKTIPLVLDHDIDNPIPDLSSVNDIYDFLTKDLRSEISNLPVNVKDPFRASRKAGSALLAQIYLFKQQYDSVAYYADKAWAGEEFLYDYNTFEKDPVSNEVSGLVTNATQKENLFYRQTARNVSTGMGYVSDELVNLYDENDLRFKYFISKRSGKGDDVEYQQDYDKNNFAKTVGFSHPEVLLLRAEAYARLNRRQDAIDVLNILKKNRYETGTEAWELGDKTQDDVIELVLNERRKELAFLTNKRFLDLKRFSVEVGKPWSKQKVVHMIGEDKYEGDIATKFQVEISPEVLEMNPHW